MSVLFPHSAWMESHASLAVPVVTTPRPATSVQLRVMCPLASWSRKFHSSMLGVVEYMGVGSGGFASVSVSVCGRTGRGIFPSIYPDKPFDPKSWVMFVVHDRRLSPLNFCSSERIVNDGVPEVILCNTKSCVCMSRLFLFCLMFFQVQNDTGPITYCETQGKSQSAVVITTSIAYTNLL